MEESTDFIATELLKELKESNTRKDQYIAQSSKYQLLERIGWLTVILCIVAGFLLYLNQYDFTSADEYTYDYTATGVYALVDSEGNVIAKDFTEDELNDIMEVLKADGYSSEESNSQENPAEDTQ